MKGVQLPAALSQEVSDAVATLVNQSEHLAALSDDPGFNARWLRNIMKGYGERVWRFDFPTAFLLSLLNNIESWLLPLEWHENFAEDEEWTGAEEQFNRSPLALVHLLTTRANDVELKDQPLQKLRIIYPTPGVDTQFGVGMENIFMFLTLDSMRELQHVLGVYDPGYEHVKNGLPWYYSSLGRQLEVIKLKDCVMNHHGAALFFKDMKHLRVLELEYSMKDEIGYGWHADHFILELDHNVGDTLESLVLSAGLVFPDTEVIVDSSMRGFKVLAHLGFDTMFFVNGTGSWGDPSLLEDGSDDSDEEKSNAEEDNKEEAEETEDDEDEGEEHDEMDELDNEDEESEGTHDGENDNSEQRDDEEQHGEQVDTEGYSSDEYCSDDDDIWRLVDQLPASLQTLVIRTPATKRDCRCLEKLFDGFEDRREKRLPLLKQVEVHMRIKDSWDNELDEFQQYIDRARAYFEEKDLVQFYAP